MKPKLPCPRIERRKKKGGWNFTIYARNGKVIYPNNNQQFRRMIDFRSSLAGLNLVTNAYFNDEIPLYTKKGSKWVNKVP